MIQASVNLLAIWLTGVATSADTIPVILLPFPIAELIRCGKWRTIIALVRWHKLLNWRELRRELHLGNGIVDHFPPPTSDAWRAQGLHSSPEVPPDLTPGNLDYIASHMRHWAPIILKEVQDEDFERERLILEECITHLRLWSVSLSDAIGLQCERQGQATRLRYTSE